MCENNGKQLPVSFEHVGAHIDYLRKQGWILDFHLVLVLDNTKIHDFLFFTENPIFPIPTTLNIFVPDFTIK